MIAGNNSLCESTERSVFQ